MAKRGCTPVCNRKSVDDLSSMLLVVRKSIKKPKVAYSTYACDETKKHRNVPKEYRYWNAQHKIPTKSPNASCALSRVGVQQLEDQRYFCLTRPNGFGFPQKVRSIRRPLITPLVEVKAFKALKKKYRHTALILVK